jgi:hypothetical protein
VGDTFVVARWCHAVVVAQGVKAVGQIVSGDLVEILEGR